jgi:hypothetical protein
MQEGKLTRLLTRAWASPPRGWQLAGVMRRQIATQWAPIGNETAEDEWVGLALQTKGPGATIGAGTSPEQALANLAQQLRQIAGLSERLAAASVGSGV